jgi:hypothetical protein
MARWSSVSVVDRFAIETHQQSAQGLVTDECSPMVKQSQGID